jgi:beta-glucosidase
MDGSISARAVDMSAQEDARQFTWNADGAFVVNGPAVDLSKPLKEDWSLLIDWRIDQPATGSVMLSFGGAALDIKSTMRALPTGTPTQTRIALLCRGWREVGGGRFPYTYAGGERPCCDNSQHSYRND